MPDNEAVEERLERENADKPERCAFVSRFVALLLTLAGVVMAIMTVLSCDYATNKSAGATVGLVFWSLSEGQNVTGATELSNYIDGGTTNKNGCRAWDFSSPSYSKYLYVARIFFYIGFLCGVIALCLILFQLCFIAKLWGAACLESIIFGLALTAMGFTNLIFGGPYCAGGCTMGRGAEYSIATFCLYLAASLVVSCTPKPSRSILARCCCKKKKYDDKADPNTPAEVELPKVEADDTI